MNVIITGASRGIGYELVKLFATDPENKIIAIARNEVNLNKLKKECLEINQESNVIVLPFDLKNIYIPGALLKQNGIEVDSVDVLINNAGIIVNKSFEEINLSDFESVYFTNVFSVARLIQQVIPLMGKNGRSHVVNISSIGGLQGSAKFAGLSVYSSSKAALAVLTECLAEEFKDKNVSFNCLALGAVQTEMLNEAFPGYKSPVSAKQMAEFIFHFASTAQNFMNGKIIPVSLSTP